MWVLMVSKQSKDDCFEKIWDCVHIVLSYWHLLDKVIKTTMNSQNEIKEADWEERVDEREKEEQ